MKLNAECKAKLKELQEMSQAIGERPDYVQGRSGNTSVKLDDSLMAIKASGHRLTDISDEAGFAIVKYPEIYAFFDENDPDDFPDLEKAGTDIVMDNVVTLAGEEIRPSVGTGFHSQLKKYVIHSHSVYMNVATCANEGIGLVTRLFLDEDYDWLWLPYHNPGVRLAFMIERALRKHYSRRETVPQMIALQNNGMIVHADTMEECMEIHERAQAKLIKRFRIKEDYPEIKLEKADDKLYRSATEGLTDMLDEKDWSEKVLMEDILYPDQYAYLADNLAFTDEAGAAPVPGKALLNSRDKTILYAMNKGKATAIEQTIVAVLFILRTMKSNRMTPRLMDDSAKAFMGNWESEKYRRLLLDLDNN